MGLLAVVATFFYGMWRHTSAGRERDRIEAEEKANEVEKLGNEAAYVGLQRDQEIRNETVDTSKRDHFS